MDAPLRIPKAEKEGKLVLVVERDPFYKKFMDIFFKQARLEPEFVPDGITALKRIKTRKPDLIIVDVPLPKIDGLTLCRHIHEDRNSSDVPVLVFSVLDIEEEASEAGADGFLQKPFDEASFSEAVSQYLRVEKKEQTS